MRDAAQILAWLVLGAVSLSVLAAVTKSMEAPLYKALSIVIALAAIVAALVVLL